MSTVNQSNPLNADILTNRHDILILFEVTNGNPNGDPDAGNMPRIEPNSKCYVSPAFADKTGFTNADLKLLFEALNDLFTHDRSAARGDMIVRGVYDFEHVGTQPESNKDQNKREARLGCAHAHVLLEGIEVRLQKKNSDGGDKEETAPQSFADYEIINRWDSNDPGNKEKDGKEQSKSRTLPKGVKLHMRHETPLRTISERLD